MKLIYVTCNISVQEKVLNTLEKLQVKDFQIIDKVKAKPVIGNPRLNNSIWPGFNTSIMVQIQDNTKAENIMKSLKELNLDSMTQDELITACSLPMDDYFFD